MRWPRRAALLDRHCARRQRAPAGRDGRMAPVEQKDWDETLSQAEYGPPLYNLPVDYIRGEARASMPFTFYCTALVRRPCSLVSVCLRWNVSDAAAILAASAQSGYFPVMMRAGVRAVFSEWHAHIIANHSVKVPSKYFSGTISSRYLKHGQQTTRPICFASPHPRQIVSVRTCFSRSFIG
jgi:hypothetical protein